MVLKSSKLFEKKGKLNLINKAAFLIRDFFGNSAGFGSQIVCVLVEVIANTLRVNSLAVRFFTEVCYDLSPLFTRFVLTLSSPHQAIANAQRLQPLDILLLLVLLSLTREQVPDLPFIMVCCVDCLLSGCFRNVLGAPSFIACA
jgi:hypothetical protein